MQWPRSPAEKVCDVVANDRGAHQQGRDEVDIDAGRAAGDADSK